MFFFLKDDLLVLVSLSVRFSCSRSISTLNYHASSFIKKLAEEEIKEVPVLFFCCYYSLTTYRPIGEKNKEKKIDVRSSKDYIFVYIFIFICIYWKNSNKYKSAVTVKWALNSLLQSSVSLHH